MRLLAPHENKHHLKITPVLNIPILQYGNIFIILSSKARVPVAQLVRASDRHSEGLDLNPG